MTRRLRIPLSPEERLEQQRKLKAARQARWRAKARDRAKVIAAVDAAAGVGPPVDRDDLPKMPAEDLAKLMRDRIHAIVETLPDDALLNKDFAPAINLGLKAQAQLDSREKVKAKQGNAQLAFAILQMLGQGPPQPLIEDGKTVEGEFEEVADGDD